MQFASEYLAGIVSWPGVVGGLIGGALAAKIAARRRSIPIQEPKPETSRAEMNEALKRLVVPELRAMGFKGSMPHLRRRRDGEWDLLTFQFSQWGGQFVVEAARCRDTGVDTVNGHVAAEKARAWDLPRRYRVGSTPDYDHWFKYEKDDPDAVAERLLVELRKPSLWETADQLPND